VKAFCKMDWRRRVARWRLADKLAPSLRAVLRHAPFGHLAERNITAFFRPFKDRRVLGFATHCGVTALLALGYRLSPRWGWGIDRGLRG
jgi:hypothetical protein